MKYSLNIIVIIIFLNSCNQSENIEKEIKEKAIQITDILDENNIDVFRKWNFEYRGKNEIWRKRENGLIIYRANYWKGKDTTQIYTFKRFLYTEFPCIINIDTTLYKTSFFFKKYENGKLKIEAKNKKGNDVLIGENINLTDVFVDKNPFIELDLLSNLKDKLNVYRISSYQRVGDFIEFDIGNQYVLTYIPSYSNLNPDYKEVWLRKFSKGIKIREKWNLRKLERPRDNG